MGYLIGELQTYCGFKGTHRITCPKCKTDNVWQKLSLINYRCTRCNLNMSMNKQTIKQFSYVETQSDLKEAEIKQNENN